MNRSMTIHLEQITVGALFNTAQAMTKADAPGDAIVTVRRLRKGGYDLEVQWGAEEAGKDARKEASDA